MNASEKLVIRAGGFCLVFFSMLSGFFLFAFFMALWVGPAPGQSIVGVCLGSAFMLGLPLYFVYFLVNQKIEIDGDFLKARFLWGSTIKPIEWRVRIADIDSVVLGTIRQLKKAGEHTKSKAVENMIDSYENLTLTVAPAYIPVSMSPAVQFTPLIILKMKEQKEAHVIITKPFSRKSGRALFAALRARGVSVTGDEKL